MHVAITLYTVQMVSKQLHSNTQDNNKVNVGQLITSETINLISGLKQLHKRR